MKRILLFALLLAACGKEDKVSPANSSTFLRYFNGGNNDDAVSVIETSDKGLLILASTVTDKGRYKIKLIRTDEAGNQQWEKFFPPFGAAVGDYKAGGMFIKDDGSIAIAGSDIGNISQLMLLTTADDATLAYASKTFTTSSNIEGTAVTVNSAGDFLLLGTVPDPTIQRNTVMARLSPGLDSLWSSLIGDSPVIMANKVFLDDTKESLFLGGTTQRSLTFSMKLTNVSINPLNEGGIISNPAIGDPAYQVIGNDFCRYGDQWAFVGSTNEKRKDGVSTIGGDLDIVYYRVSANDPQFSPISATYPVESDGPAQSEIGNSLCVTKEGGLLLLGTVNSQGSFGKGGKDYYLIKIDALGNVQWTKQYGSKFDDSGVQVIQASNGGYIVLGTTTFANLKTIMLMKTTSDGSIQ